MIWAGNVNFRSPPGNIVHPKYANKFFLYSKMDISIEAGVCFIYSSAGRKRGGL